MAKDELDEMLNLFKQYWWYAGNWHDAECRFIRDDEGVCNCSIAWNPHIKTPRNNKFIKAEVRRLIREAQLKELQDALTLWSAGETKQHMLARVAELSDTTKPKEDV